MKIVAPRWLALALLPSLAAALYFVNQEILYAPVRLANARDFDATSTILLFMAFVVGPMLTALVFAYPLARVYARRAAAVAGLVVAFPTIADALHERLHDPVGNASLVLASGLLAVFVPVVAALAARALAGSRLVVACPAADASGDEALPGTEPRALRWVLLPLLAIAFFILRELIQGVAWDIAMLPVNPTLERAGLFAAAVVGPAGVALLLAYPVARIYEHRAAWVGFLVSLPTAVFWASTYLAQARLPLVKVMNWINLVGLVVMLAVAAWVVWRRLGGSRLGVVAAGSIASS